MLPQFVMINGRIDVNIRVILKYVYVRTKLTLILS